MSPKANITHDITIETLGDTTSRRGFMLAANRRQIRGHRVTDAQTIQPRQLTMGELTEAESPPDIAIYWSQETWQLGIGGVNHRLDPRKGAIGREVDTSSGRLRSGAKLREMVLDEAATSLQPTGFAVVGTEVWAFIQRDVYQYNASTGELDKGTVPEAADKMYRNGVEFGTRTFVPGWDIDTDEPDRYIFKADADANWTVHPNTSGASWGGAKFKYFAKGRNADGDEIMWGGYQDAAPHHIRFSTAPNTDTSATWSSAVAVGEADSEITALISDDDTVLVCKTNGVWAVFSDLSVRNLTPEFEVMAHPDNFRGAFNWNGHVLLPLGAGGMVELNHGQVFNVGLDLYAPEQTSLHGRVVAIAGDPTTLFIVVQEGITQHLLMAKWVEFAQHRDFRWHVVARKTPGTGMSLLHTNLFAEGVPHGSLTHHRIWWAIDDNFDKAIAPLFYPIDNEDHLFAYSESTTQEFITVLYDANFPHISKAFQTLDARVNNLGAGGRTIVVQYRVDGGNWTALGTLNTTGSTQTLTFADGVDGKTLELKFLPKQTTATDTSPELLYFRVTAQLRPSQIETLGLALYLADNMKLLNGAVAGTVKGDLAQLRTWAGQVDEVVVVDSEGTSRNMVVLPGSLVVSEVGHEWGRRSEYLVRFNAAEVS